MKRLFASAYLNETYHAGQYDPGNIVTPATREHERIDGFHAMNGYTIAQTVAMKIEGVHMPRTGAHDLRPTPDSIRAIY